MDIREEQSLISLFIESFSLANRAGASLAACLLIFVLLVGGSLWLMIHFFSSVASHMLVMTIVWILFYTLMIGLTTVALFRLLGAKAERNNESVSDAFANAVLPFIYLILNQLIVGIAMVAVGFPLMLIPLLGTIIFALLSVYLVLRLGFAPLAIILRDAGPISALTYSWQLTKEKALYVLGAYLMAAIPSILASALIHGVRYAIPTYFASSFDLANLSLTWMIALMVFVGILVFLSIASWAFIVLVFLNLDYGINRASFLPMPQVEINEQPVQVFGTDNNVMPPGAGNTVTTKDVAPHVEVLQASVKSETDHPEITQHLHQVYQPKPEDIVEYAEEDRMPTILFDDEMAQQLQHERAMWEEKMNTDKNERDDSDSSSIKMSK